MSSELNGVTADVVNSVYFLQGNHMAFNTHVKKDTTIILPQTTLSIGKYTRKGNLKKGIMLDIETTDNCGLIKHTKAVVNKNGLFVSDTDTTAVVYFLVSNLKVE